MSELNSALLFLDLDKGVEAAGPLFDEPRRRLDEDRALRAQWNQFLALRALAWECAPEPGEKLIRLALAESRREHVKQQLARTAGSEDLARKILLGRIKERRGLGAWASSLVLVGGLGLTWVLLGPQILALFWPERAQGIQAPAAAAPAGPGADDQAVPFEFPAQGPPARAALAAPDQTQDDAGRTDEDPAAQQARLLLQAHLRAQAETTAAPTPQARAPRLPAPTKPLWTAFAPIPAPEPPLAPPSPPPTAIPTAAPTEAPTAIPTRPPTAVPTRIPTAVPTAVPTAAPTTVPTALPTAVPTRIPTAAPTPFPKAAGNVSEASLELSAPSTKPGGSLLVRLGMPQRREIDLRLFDQRGRPVKALSNGDQGPGMLLITLVATDALGQKLMPGLYYLRVMTPWFSRVEPIEVSD